MGYWDLLSSGTTGLGSLASPNTDTVWVYFGILNVVNVLLFGKGLCWIMLIATLQEKVFPQNSTEISTKLIKNDKS